MISTINSFNEQGQSNPSFGKMSVGLKQFVRTPGIKNHLEKIGIDKDVLVELDKSPIKISLLKDLFEPLTDNQLAKGANDIPEAAGLLLLPPRGSHLPNLCVTANDEELLEANADTFIFSMQKVVDMVKEYSNGKINLNKQNRPLKVRKINDLHELDNAIDLRLKSLPDLFNYGGGEEAIHPFDTEINHINKVAFNMTNKYDVECARNKKTAMLAVRESWLDVNARRLDASA